MPQASKPRDFARDLIERADRTDIGFRLSGYGLRAIV
jgi:hypothetical protein